MAGNPRPSPARRHRRYHPHLRKADDAVEVCGVEIAPLSLEDLRIAVRMADLTGEKKGITMSQYPPPPPQPPQYPPQGMPPQGFPPQGYPQQPYGGAPQAAKSNGMAITSLIMGILSCIPGVGLLAILFGLLGMGKAKDPRVGGKGLAVVGLLLGVLGTVGWAYGAYKINQGWHLLKGMAEPAAGFFQGVADGDFSKAKSY